MISYLAPDSGGLVNQIEQISLNLDSADFTKLNTSPITLIAADNSNYICVLNQFLQYDNISINSASIINIGFEPILSVVSNSGTFAIYGSNMNGQFGMLNQVVLTYFGVENSLHNSPLVLWSAADDSSCFFNSFKLTINYIKIPKLI